ncbi:hypothetical protein F5887DRAFT_1280373 [Amanita rubescens]|nr:hypothetical protein F5887DRAFT_1280373 [Amanita rubescens]
MAAFRSDQIARKPYSRPATRGADSKWLHDKGSAGPANGASKPAPAASVNSKIVVSNLHYEITPKDLAAIFGQIGTLVREPLIRYDRSGRSSGTAIISFETPAEATRAKKQFDGILAKGNAFFPYVAWPHWPIKKILIEYLGQPMSIVYDTPPPVRPARRSASAPQSLLNRIQKPPLLDRLSRDDTAVKTPAAAAKGTVGPIRSRVRGPKPRRDPKKPKTAEELDKELDAFMGDAEPASASAAPATTGQEDVEMS